MAAMKIRLAALLLLGAVLAAPPLFGYGVLSHEELIDIAWDSDIRPALLKRFPEADPDQIKQAHAYAYGGSAIQDLGYYPFGNHEFTNLLHYVRTGDFVAWMLRDARNINDYAFALGALSHYAADIWGHPSVNVGVGIEYPNLRERFGPIVSYEQNPDAHLKTEFSFDVVQSPRNATSRSSIMISLASRCQKICSSAPSKTPTASNSMNYFISTT